MKLWIIIISITNSIRLIDCDYYGAGFPLRRPIEMPTYIRYKKIPIGYLNPEYVHRFHSGHFGGQGSGHGDSGGHSGNSAHGAHGGTHGGDDDSEHDDDHSDNNGGLVQRYLGFLTPASHRGSGHSFFSNRFQSSHESDQNDHNNHNDHNDHGGHDVGHRGGSSFQFENNSNNRQHGNSNQHNSDRYTGLLGIRFNRFNLFRRPSGKSLLDRIVG
ncbi:GATA zinc finger domain-containing protein 14-like [Panonychus citri]|uniref:GATA zinc finger domain-containing protein 14-like n=1 Tax=Panonychus citri TaxID=50023 RepID=UPI002307AB21|nr:GATA zinc finger domain-containing protein 14-like [Panonychus citri]